MRGGTAVWIPTPDGLELQTFSGTTLDSVPCATGLNDFKETIDGRVRAFATGAGWFAQERGAAPRPFGIGLNVRGYKNELSPDGRFLAFESVPDPAREYDYRFHVLDIATGSIRDVGRSEPCFCDGYIAPSWSPSGRYVAYRLLVTPKGHSAIYDTETSTLIDVDGRFGFAWDPGRDRITVSRSGAWVLQDLGTGAVTALPLPVLRPEYFVTFFAPSLIWYPNSNPKTELRAFNVDAMADVGPYYDVLDGLGAGPRLAVQRAPLLGGACDLRVIGLTGPDLCLSGDAGGISPDGHSVAVMQDHRQCLGGGIPMLVLRSLPDGRELMRMPLNILHGNAYRFYWSADRRHVLVSGEHCGV